jgi:pimeloyl-ACP methyl ester carboxylesterase
MPFANNNGVRIRYELEGRGPPLVLQHGFGGTLETWYETGYVEALKRDYNLILVDARGRGGSDKPHDPKAYALSIMVKDIVGILDALKIQKANYFGYSMGGRIGFRIPIFAPERFNSLILGGATYPLRGDEDKNDDILVSIQQDLEIALKEPPVKVAEVYVALREKRNGKMLPEARDRALKSDFPAMLTAIIAHRGDTAPDYREVLPRIKTPCFLFVGEADPRFLPAKECARLIPNAQFVSFPGQKHGECNRAELTMPYISKFLTEVNR